MSNEELAQRIQAGENDLTLELWEQVKRLVIKIIYKYLPKDGSTNRVELDDLIQAGFIGMLGAVKDFTPSEGFTFSTFLNHHLANEANKALCRRSNKQKLDPLNDAVSMDKPILSSTGENLTLADTLQDASTAYIYDDLIDDLAKHQDCQKILEQVKKLLEPMDQDFFTDKYTQGLTAPAIAEKHSIEESKVKNSIVKSLHKIRYSKTVRVMAKEREREMDHQTNFYAGKGLKGFNTTFSSAVEDIAILREKLS